MTRRIFQLALLACSFLLSGAAWAQSWPSKPIKIVIAFGPGSASDIFARVVGEQLSKALGQPVIVEAKPGASGQIAAEYSARAPADGYTLFLTTNTTHSANPFLFKKLNYDPIKDFTPIARIAMFPFALLVDSKLPIQTVPELIAYARANPQSTSYAYSSSAGQIAAAALANTTKMPVVGVAYKSAPEAITSVLSGQVSFTVLDFATSKGQMASGRLRAIATTTEARTSLAPNLPTIAEATGLTDFGVVAWLGFFGPANLPAPIVERLSTELLKIVTPKEMQDRIVAMGADPAPQGPEAFRQYVRNQLTVWERQIKLAGMKPE